MKGSWTRRRILKVGLGGGLLVGAAGLVAWQTSGYELPGPVARQLKALTVKEYVVLSALVARILQSTELAHPNAEDVGAATFIDDFVSRLEAHSRRDFKRLLHVVEHAAPVLTGRLGRFSRLDGHAQDAVLNSMMMSSTVLLRGGFDVLKTLSVMAYFRHPRSWQAIRYDGPLVGRPLMGW